MGMFAETTNVDYHLWFADQDKQTSVFPLPVPVYIYIYIYTKNGTIYTYYKCMYCIYLYTYIFNAVSNGKRKAKAKRFFLKLFTVCSSYKWKFVVCPFVNEETNGSYPFANGPNGLAKRRTFKK
jgi:hypothetical protein